MTYYKFMCSDGRSTHQGHEWPLPTAEGPGEWIEVEGDLVECENGLHGCRPSDLILWMDAQLYVVEFDGEVIEADEKIYGRRARLVSRIDAWDDRSARLFAADCAEHVAHLWTAPEGCSWDPSQTLDVVRRHANGEATDEELRAAGDAARAAARDAARAAARAAARDAAGDAAGDAAWAAAWAAERDWQTTALLERLGLSQ